MLHKVKCSSEANDNGEKQTGLIVLVGFCTEVKRFSDQAFLGGRR